MKMNKIIELQVLIDEYKEIRSHLFSEGGMPYKKITTIYEDTLEKIDKIIMEADDLLSQLSNQGEVSEDVKKLRAIAADISNGLIISRGDGIYLSKLADSLSQPSEPSEGVIKTLITKEDIEAEINKRYDLSYPSDSNKALGFMEAIKYLTQLKQKR